MSQADQRRSMDLLMLIKDTFACHAEQGLGFGHHPMRFSSTEPNPAERID